MKLLKVLALFAALNTGAWMLPQHASAQQGHGGFQLFYDELSPYGMWVDFPSYGYVWIPEGEPGFIPYTTAGHWVYTDDGWTWVSDYPWGWAAFHYGRWGYDSLYGWFWVPDHVWGPAWVLWRRAPGYYGWAPLRPGINITLAFGREYQERDERWTFVRDRDITRLDVGRHYVNRTNNVTIINSSTVIVNTRRDNRRNATYSAGPERDDVQRITRTQVRSVTIQERDRPGQHLRDGELQLYRPQVQSRRDNEKNPAPSRVLKLNEVRPLSERNAENRQRAVNPHNRIQPPQPREIIPSDNTGRQQQPRMTKLPNTIQPPQPRDIRSSNSRGKEKQPQRVILPEKRGEPQPRPDQQKQENKQQQERNIL